MFHLSAPLLSDHVSKIEVLTHALVETEIDLCHYDYVVMLQPQVL